MSCGAGHCTLEASLSCVTPSHQGGVSTRVRVAVACPKLALHEGGTAKILGAPVGYGSEQTNDGYRYRGKQNIGDRQLVREPCARIAGLVWSVVILPPGGPSSAGLG